MDEIQARLQDASQNCLKAYVEWAGRKKDSKAQEILQAAIHELRKVASRLEIDLAISERDQNTVKPLPIPSHRASKENIVDMDDDFDDAGADHGGQQEAGRDGGQKRRRMQHHMRRPSQHQQQGGGGNAGGNTGGGQ